MTSSRRTKGIRRSPSLEKMWNYPMGGRGQHNGASTPIVLVTKKVTINGCDVGVVDL